MLDSYKNAFSSVSFDPEKRFEVFCKEYEKDIKRIKAKADEHGIDATRYLQRFENIACKYLNATSRCASAAVVGFSKFPVERMEKRHRWAENWLNKLVTYPDYVIRKIERITAPEVTQTEKANAWIIKADKLEDLQNFMKKVNSLLRKGDIQQVVEMVGAEKAKQLQEPDFAGRIGYPDYKLKNNLANIKRLRAQAEKVHYFQSRNADEYSFDFTGGRVEYNAEEIRYNIFFDEIPDVNLRSKLKSMGFKWSPRRGAWTRGAKTIWVGTIRDILGAE